MWYLPHTMYEGACLSQVTPLSRETYTITKVTRGLQKRYWGSKGPVLIKNMREDFIIANLLGCSTKHTFLSMPLEILGNAFL